MAPGTQVLSSLQVIVSKWGWDERCGKGEAVWEIWLVTEYPEASRSLLPGNSLSSLSSSVSIRTPLRAPSPIMTPSLRSFSAHC